MSDIKGIPKVKARLNSIVKATKNSARPICEKLAADGAEEARNIFPISDYEGDRNVNVYTKRVAGGYAIVAKGPSVLFWEFGSGLIGYGHPFAAELGFGPGTWSDGPNGKHHWDNPKGWYIPGTASQKTHGNPPALAMYSAGKLVKEELRSLIPKIIDEARLYS